MLQRAQFVAQRGPSAPTIASSARRKLPKMLPRAPAIAAGTTTSVLTKSQEGKVATSSPRADYQIMLQQFHAVTSFDHEPVPSGVWMEVVAGKLPEQLLGTYFRNGPGKFSQGGEEYGHPFDGDGVIASVAFKDGRACFTSRFVETPEFKAEAAAGKVLFRGTFAAQRGGVWVDNALNLYTKNPSNTNVLQWGPTLMSLFEGGLPYRVDPATLETLGSENLDGKLHPGLTFYMDPESTAAKLVGVLMRSLGDNNLLPPDYTDGGGSSFTAHPHIDPATGRLCCFTMQHDTQEPGLQVDVLPNVLGQAAIGSCAAFARNTPSAIHIIPRPGSAAARQGQRPRVFPAAPAFVFHHANCFEQGPDDASGLPAVVVVDSVHYSTLPEFPKIGQEHLAAGDPYEAFKGRLCRTRIDLAAGTVDISPITPSPLDFPTINGSYYSRPYRFIFAQTWSSPTAPTCHALLKVNTHTGTTASYDLPPGTILNEPKFIPFPDAAAKDDGWVVAITTNSVEKRSQLVVLDARDLEAGPLAVLAVPSALPLGFHGSWSTTYHGPAAA